MLFNPIVAMLFNQKTERWHTIVFVERPFPGALTAESPRRWKSDGHHTPGHDTREEAITYARDVYGAAILKNTGITPKYALEGDIQWDGEDIPALSLLFFEQSDGSMKPML